VPIEAPGKIEEEDDFIGDSWPWVLLAFATLCVLWLLI
jgi:hypothetical protein